MKKKSLTIFLLLLFLFSGSLPSEAGVLKNLFRPVTQTFSPRSSFPLIGSGNPNGSLAGNIGTQYFDSTNIVDYICTTSGNSSGAVWTRKGIPQGAMCPWFPNTAAPAGWIICDGGTHSGVATPNMIGMHIQGCNISGGSTAGNSSGFDTGGSVTTQSVVGVTSASSSHSHTAGSLALQGNQATINAGAQAPVWENGCTIGGGTGSATVTSSTQAASVALPWIMKL